MKIITLNCFLSPWSPRRKSRLPLIVKELAKEKSDIALLQEVYFKSDADYLIKELSKFGFTASFYSKTLLIVSRHSFISSTHYNFQIQSSRWNFLLYLNEISNLIYGKGFQIVELKVKDQLVAIINTHLISAYGLDHGIYREVRMRQVSEICDYIKNIKTKQVILGGDFNFDINSPSYNATTNHYGFIDPLKMVLENTISTDNLNRKFFLTDKMNQRLDHIFVKGFEQHTTSGGVVFREPHIISQKTLHISDHYGLFLNIQ
jgi:endonuclease/exonuclease/phosphatase family metal-dependent hydrolase